MELSINNYIFSDTLMGRYTYFGSCDIVMFDVILLTYEIVFHNV